MIKTLDSLDKGGNIVDLTTATDDYPLQVGETATLTYTSTTSVPLRVATVDGLYALDIIGKYGTASSNSDITLSINNTTYSNTIVLANIWVSSGNEHGTETSSNGSVMRVGQGLGIKSLLQLSTYTDNKHLHGLMHGRFTDGTHYTGTQTVYSTDTTTQWTSLGTIAFPFAQSGKIVIRRIA